MQTQRKLPVSRLTAKAQTTLPKEVRQALGLVPGDALIYEIEADRAILRKAPAIDRSYLAALQSTLSEWESPEDAAAFDDL